MNIIITEKAILDGQLMTLYRHETSVPGCVFQFTFTKLPVNHLDWGLQTMAHRPNPAGCQFLSLDYNTTTFIC